MKTQYIIRVGLRLGLRLVLLLTVSHAVSADTRPHIGHVQAIELPISGEPMAPVGAGFG
jgi:hypothetical protein